MSNTIGNYNLDSPELAFRMNQRLEDQADSLARIKDALLGGHERNPDGSDGRPSLAYAPITRALTLAFTSRDDKLIDALSTVLREIV